MKLLIVLIVALILNIILLSTFVYCNGGQLNANTWGDGGAVGFGIITTFIWLAVAIFTIIKTYEKEK